MKDILVGDMWCRSNNRGINIRIKMIDEDNVCFRDRGSLRIWTKDEFRNKYTFKYSKSELAF